MGQWLYGEAGTEDEKILQLRNEIEPLHKELHESASYVLNLAESSPRQAQEYYHETIQSNLGVLVGLLDEVVDRGTALNEESAAVMRKTIFVMHATSIIGLSLELICLVSLVLYVLKNVIRPMLHITEKVQPLQQGLLDMQLNYSADNELGDLARTLETSVQLIHSYIEDINRIMGQLSEGNFDVSTSAVYIGDFSSIAQSINSFTDACPFSLTRSCTIFRNGKAANRKIGGNRGLAF